MMLREPKLVRMQSVGDFERWLWVMEPVKGRIFGKAFVISATELCEKTAEEIEAIKREAYDEMIARSNSEEPIIPEGSFWEEFL